jgi:polar amino acid transport system substrate-binding protein
VIHVPLRRCGGVCGTALWVIGWLIAHAPCEARDLTAIKASGVLLLATEGATPPFNYFDKGQLTGFDIDLGAALASRLGVRPQWAAAAFETLLIGLEQDRYDLVVMDQAITPARASVVNFSDPYLCSGAVIVTLSGGPRRRQDLAGRIVGVQVGTTYLESVRNIPGLREVKTYPKDTDALQNLLARRTDAWISDRLTAGYLARSNPNLQLQIGEQLFTEHDGIAVAKNNESLRLAVNRALAALAADGTMHSLAMKRFGQDAGCD